MPSFVRWHDARREPASAASSAPLVQVVQASLVQILVEDHRGRRRTGNSLLADRHLEMLTLLRMNRKFMQFMLSSCASETYNDLTKDAFKTTVVVHTSQGPSTPAAKQAKRAPPPDADSSMEEDEWETPTSIDATEPRLEVEAVPDDEGIMPDAAAAGVGRALRVCVRSRRCEQFTISLFVFVHVQFTAGSGSEGRVRKRARSRICVCLFIHSPSPVNSKHCLGRSPYELVGTL